MGKGLKFINQGAVAQRCSVRKVFLEISQNSLENTCVRVSFLIKKETLAKVFSCEFCAIFKNTFFIEQLRWLLLLTLDSQTSQFPNFATEAFPNL